MIEDIETEQNEYEFPLFEEVANNLTEPAMHAYYHELCLKDRERHDNELEELRETAIDYLKRIEDLERTVSTLALMIGAGQAIVQEKGRAF